MTTSVDQETVGIDRPAPSAFSLAVVGEPPWRLARALHGAACFDCRRTRPDAAVAAPRRGARTGVHGAACPRARDGDRSSDGATRGRRPARDAVVGAASETRCAQDELLFAIYGGEAPALVASDDVIYRTTDTTLALPALPPLPKAVASAIEARPDVQGARDDVEQGRVNERVARNALLPTFNFGGSLLADGVARSGWSLARRDVETGNKLDWGVGFTVAYPARAWLALSTTERASDCGSA